MSDQETCRFRVQLTAKELWRFSMYHTNKGMLGILNLVFSVGALVLLCVNWSASNTTYKLVLFLCILMFTVWQPGLLYRKAAIQAKTPAIAVPMDLRFGENGLKVKQGGNTLDLPWEHIARVERGPGMIILYIDKVHAYLVPAQAMNGQEQALRALLRKYLPGERRKRI